MTIARGMTVVLFLMLAGCGGSGATVPACTTPDRAPQVVKLVQPDAPPLAQQQGIQGDVVVHVTLDGSGAVTTAVIVTSPSSILNSAALQAARASTYVAGLQNCRAGGSLDVTIVFATQVNVQF